MRRTLWVLTLAVSAAQAQDSTAKRDTTRRPVPTLPAVETTAPRKEREVFEQKPNVATVTISAKELASAPRFFGESDILRAVRALPGVNARNDFSVGMNVRGGEADQNLVLLDGYPVYNPFHMGGLFGAFVQPMVDRVDFYTGGFPASYGGRLSSVLDVHSAIEPRIGKMHGQTDVSFIATTLALGQGIQGGRGTWTVAARRTYADKFADLIGKDGSLPYHFSDVQGHLEIAMPYDLRWAATVYHNVDHMIGDGSDPDNTFLLHWGNDVLGTTISRCWCTTPRIFGLRGDSLVVEQRASLSRFNLTMDFFRGVITLNNHVKDAALMGQLKLYGATHSPSIGYELGARHYDFNSNFPLLLYPADTLGNTDRSLGVFVDDMWKPTRDWIVQMGTRMDLVSGNAPVVQPRLSVKYFVNDGLALTGAVGSFAQWAHSLAREDVPIRALDFWTGSSESAPVSRAWHAIGGVEKWVTTSRSIRVEGYYKRYGSLVEQNPFSDPNLPGDEFNHLHGYSFGADMMLRQLELKGFSGWIAYSFGYSKRFTADNKEFFPGQDRRHELNVIGNWQRERWTTSLRFNVATGTPFTVPLGQYDRTDYNPGRADFGGEITGTQYVNGPRNASRLPITQRLDVSVTRNGHIGHVSVTPVLSIMNIYNAKNVFAYIYNYGATPPSRFRLRQLPVFPTLGVSIVW